MLVAAKLVCLKVKSEHTYQTLHSLSERFYNSVASVFLSSYMYGSYNTSNEYIY